MRKQHSLTAFLLIGIGAYFLLRQLKLPIITDFYSWPTLLIILGVAFLLHAYIGKDYDKLFPGAILLGFGIHFHGLNHYGFWIDHWGIYTLIVGVAFMIRFQKTKTGLLPGLLLIILSIFAVFVSNKPSWFHWINSFMALLESFWPVALVALGVYLLIKRK
ncbi:hypothetical protein Pryu01_01290 [Paraliobacillus ryukyuensis]|uniref:LiaI-LiaF-like transmembrane region domain-containing protein n=1 Tax=Paraliobacillus ryukyuensis TaxID=200904 RepID=A0A366EAT4_9BACI|nr:DUF5668 domain-containing protein [Paraliobacillus ryukyuensis]RBO99476.1 hypothetical protein DES48_104151 [Paraliobacillus ryukyuensis]